MASKLRPGMSKLVLFQAHLSSELERRRSEFQALLEEKGFMESLSDRAKNVVFRALRTVS